MKPAEANIDNIDRAILNSIQSDFPLTPRPYKSIGQRLKLSENELIKRVRRMKDAGVIRRIGGNFTPHALGFVSTLCAAKVPEDKISQFADAVNRYEGVTHNYRRDNAFNVWFTFIAPSMDAIEANLKQIAADTGVTDILNLPATHVFKIKAEFKI
ncbi:MAG: AsnC family transcriptional regulator [Deltaproteobacteria bacterium]|jgi:DNA-binding Lrp family transcriptional regulator|nr:AsnC family transcriptional regulator [Deltaproteobacteria bacterium]MBW2468182.1 AsnC family transcriptional regulator [Deltaproteobacteria bacterium]MBW2486725.1 AsnC family transcriptional regulator [Deltaproteobacteria bacterium]MBW2516033.1 AsnC family transcriptional regulator [Deltaproteobacteria bacterium]